MGSSFSQLKDLFVNESCVPLEQLFEQNKAGLALGLVCFAVATFLIEALIVLAVLSCSVRELRLQGAKGFFWRLGACLCVPRKLTRAELQDLERTQRLASDPTSTRKFRREPLELEEAETAIVPGAPALPPPPRSGFTGDSRQRRTTSDAGQSVALTRRTRPARPSPLTIASGRRLKGDAESTWRDSPAATSMRSGGSSRGRSRAQQFAAEIMGNDDRDEPTVMIETASPPGSGFPFPHQNSSASMPRRAPTTFSESPGSMWTRRK